LLDQVKRERSHDEASEDQIRTAQRRGREDLPESGHQTWLEEQHEHHAIGLPGPRADSLEAASKCQRWSVHAWTWTPRSKRSPLRAHTKRSRSRPRALGERE